MEHNIPEIKKIISSRKKKTNCFSFYNEIMDWIDTERAHAYLIENCVFIFLRANSFYKFYYFVDQFEELALSKELIEQYNELSDISLEFTTKNDKNVEEVSKAVHQIGFQFYAEIARIIPAGVNKLKEEEDDKQYFQYATLEDKDKLLEIMHRDFDVIIDDIPTPNELIKLINQKSIAIRYIDGKIIFIQIYEYKHGTLYARMLWIDKQYRKPKYTIEIYKGIDDYLREMDFIKTKNFRNYFWVNTQNVAYKINMKIGAKPDGVKCITFLSKKNCKLSESI